MNDPKTLVFDFDGTIHSYTSGWQGPTTIPDPPVDGMREALANLHASGYEIIINSTRCNYLDGRAAIRRWLAKYGMAEYVDRIVTTKPPAIAYIDDRAINFDGDAGLMVERIKRFVPWTQGGRSEAYHGPIFDHPYVSVISKALARDNTTDIVLRDALSKLFDELNSTTATDDSVMNRIASVICLSAVKLDSMGIPQRDIMDTINRRLAQAVMPETQATGAHDADLPPDAQ